MGFKVLVWKKKLSFWIIALDLDSQSPKSKFSFIGWYHKWLQMATHLQFNSGDSSKPSKWLTLINYCSRKKGSKTQLLHMLTICTLYFTEHTLLEKSPRSLKSKFFSILKMVVKLLGFAPLLFFIFLFLEPIICSFRAAG